MDSFIYPNINVSASCSSTREFDSQYNRVFECDAPITVDSKNLWFSNTNPGNTYTVSFDDFSIYLISYSVQVGIDSAYPKQWILEGIDSKNQHTTLSTVDESNLNQNYSIGVFFNEGPKGPYKQFKFTSTGQNYASPSNSGYDTYKNSFYLYKVDFFGYANILSNMHSWNVCPRHSNMLTSYVFILIAY